MTDENSNTADKEISLDIPGSMPSTEPRPVNRDRSPDRAEEAIRLVNKINSGQPIKKETNEENIERPKVIPKIEVDGADDDGIPLYNIIVAKYTSFEIGGVKKEFLTGKSYTVTKEIKDLLVEAGVVAR